MGRSLDLFHACCSLGSHPCCSLGSNHLLGSLWGILYGLGIVGLNLILVRPDGSGVPLFLVCVFLPNRAKHFPFNVFIAPGKFEILAISLSLHSMFRTVMHSLDMSWMISFI